MKSLFRREPFEALIGSLKAVEIVHQWGDASVGKVGGKIFAIQSYWGDGVETQVSFKCSDLSYTMLTELNGISPAKYLARAKWVDVMPDSELSEDDIAAYICEAHRLIAAKLPRRVRAELGLD